jgi:chemotaxis-related protein WspD
MSELQNPGLTIDDCWNRIGVWGNAECPELKKVVHCRNCQVYSAAAARLLDRSPPADYQRSWGAHFSKAKEVEAADTHSVVIFRVGEEWLALPTQVFKEVSDLRTVHTLPHRRNGIVLGLVNIRGELLICVSLAEALGLARRAAGEPAKLAGRLLVVSREGGRLVFPVDEIYGIHRFAGSELKAVPATVAKAPATYVKSGLPWQDKTVGCLDDQLLFYTLNRSLA